MPVLLTATFNWEVDDAAAAEVPIKHAQGQAEMPGLRWKIWVRDPETKTNGGIYLFDTREIAADYVRDWRARLDAVEGISDLSATIFDIKEPATAITRGPVELTAII